MTVIMKAASQKKGANSISSKVLMGIIRTASLSVVDDIRI